MNIIWLNGEDLRPTNEPLMALVHAEGEHAYVSSLDDGFEHIILYRKFRGNDKDFENYFRIIFDTEGADWTFVCPPEYKGIQNKEKRIETFYRDGIDTIVGFLKTMGYPEIINIPKRYRRHIEYLSNTDF